MIHAALSDKHWQLIERTLALAIEEIDECQRFEHTKSEWRRMRAKRKQLFTVLKSVAVQTRDAKVD